MPYGPSLAYYWGIFFLQIWGLGVVRIVFKVYLVLFECLCEAMASRAPQSVSVKNEMRDVPMRREFCVLKLTAADHEIERQKQEKLKQERAASSVCHSPSICFCYLYSFGSKNRSLHTAGVIALPWL